MVISMRITYLIDDLLFIGKIASAGQIWEHPAQDRIGMVAVMLVVVHTVTFKKHFFPEMPIVARW